MSICSRNIALEALTAGGIAAGIAVLANPADPWLGDTALHPSWLAVLAMAAFYGLRGLVIATPVVGACLALTGLLTGAGFTGMGERLATGADALPLLAGLLVAGAAMVHRRRQNELSELLEAVGADADTAEKSARESRELAIALQARQDRIEYSVTFWRDLAARLESGEPGPAAEAALELCIARTGARAGLVRRYSGGHLHNLAWRGQWSDGVTVPRDIFPDRTIEAAVKTGRPTLADQVPGARPEDSDIAAPIVNPHTGEIAGVLALRGAARSRLQETELGDVAALAHWLANALTPETRAPVPATSQPQPEPPASAGVVLSLAPHLHRRAPTWD